MRPLDQIEVIQAFGDPSPYRAPDGFGVAAEWERLILGWARLPAALPLSFDPAHRVTIFRCHRRLMGAFERALRRIHENAEAWATIDDFGGCYAWRPNRRDKRKLSLHSWGIAIDLDVRDNPQGEPFEEDREVHPWTIESFELEGFLWGGRFTGKSRDEMHWEFADLARLG